MMFPTPILDPIRAMADKDDDASGAPGVGIATRTRAKPKKPSMYKVLLLNDDYTPSTSAASASAASSAMKSPKPR